MNKTRKTLALLCALSLLCSCAERSKADTAPPVSETEPRVTTQPEPPITAAPTPITLVSARERTERHSAIYTEYSLGERGGAVEGEPIPAEELVKFEYRPISPESAWYDESLGAFLDELGIPEIAALSKRAHTLMLLLFTENFGTLTNMRESDARLLLSENDLRYETGIDYESFCGAYLDVFTEGAAERLFSAYSFFGAYGGGLWIAGTSGGGNAYLVRREYELLERTEDEIAFRVKEFSEDYRLPLSGEPVYDPEKRGEYLVKLYDTRMIRTDEGWRVEEFYANGLTVGREELKPLEISGDGAFDERDSEIFDRYFKGKWLHANGDPSQSLLLDSSENADLKDVVLGGESAYLVLKGAAGAVKDRVYAVRLDDPDVLYEYTNVTYGETERGEYKNVYTKKEALPDGEAENGN